VGKRRRAYTYQVDLASGFQIGHLIQHGFVRIKHPRSVELVRFCTLAALLYHYIAQRDNPAPLRKRRVRLGVQPRNVPHPYNRHIYHSLPLFRI
jgi:hypothetical protein